MNEDEYYFLEEMRLDNYMESRVYDYTDSRPWNELPTLSDFLGD